MKKSRSNEVRPSRLSLRPLRAWRRSGEGCACYWNPRRSIRANLTSGAKNPAGVSRAPAQNARKKLRMFASCSRSATRPPEQRVEQAFAPLQQHDRGHARGPGA